MCDISSWELCEICYGNDRKGIQKLKLEPSSSDTSFCSPWNRQKLERSRQSDCLQSVGKKPTVHLKRKYPIRYLKPTILYIPDFRFLKANLAQFILDDHSQPLSSLLLLFTLWFLHFYILMWPPVLWCWHTSKDHETLLPAQFLTL